MENSDVQRLLKKKRKYQQEGNIKFVAETCREIAEYYSEIGLFEKALPEFQEEADIFKRLCKNLDYGLAIRRVGETYLSMGSHENALKHINEYLSIAKTEKNLLEIQRAYTTLGRCYLTNYITTVDDLKDTKNSQNDLKLAEKHFRTSLDLTKELAGSVGKRELADMQARLYLNIALLKEYLKDPRECLENYDIAIKLCKSNDLNELLHKCLLDCALTHSKQDDTAEALRVLGEAHKLAKRLRTKKQSVCETLIAKAELMIINGDFQSAKQALKKAYRIVTPVETDRENIEKSLKVIVNICKYEDQLVVTDSFDFKKRKEIFEKLGDCACKLKNYSKAIDFYKKQLEAALSNDESGSELIPIYVSLYQTLNDNGQHQEALEYLWKEYEICKEEPKEAQQTLTDIAATMEKDWISKRTADRNQTVFWEIVGMYERAWNEAKQVNAISIEKPIVEKLLKFCKNNKMDSTFEYQEKEAQNRGISFEPTVIDSEEVVENSEDMFLETVDFDDVNLEELSSDPESSGDDEIKQQNVAKRPRRTIAVKKNEKGETRLHRACIDGNLQMVKMLVDQGHPVNISDHAGWLPLHEAANHGYVDVVEYLLNNGAQSAINHRGMGGVSALVDACSNGHLNIVILLLDRGAKAFLKADDGTTALSALELYYDASGHLLSEEEDLMYKQIHSRISEQFEKIGVDAKSSGLSSNKSSSTGSSRRSHQSSGYASSLMIENETPKKNPSTEVPRTRRYSNPSSDNDTDDERTANKARREYKDVMSRLKHRNTETLRINNIPEAKKKPHAFMESQEVDPEHWLDDDLGPSRKKQKFFNEANLNREFSPLKENVKANICKSSSFSKKNSGSFCLDSDEEFCENTTVIEVDNDSQSSSSRDAFDVLMSNENSRKSLKKPQKTRMSLSRGFSKRTSQSSLLEAGFSRFQDNDDFSLSPVKSLQKSPDSTSFVHLNESFSQRNFSSARDREKQVIIKVLVMDEKIIVPIKEDSINDVKISWLIEETSRRYYCLKGIRPELKLTTTDGATLLTSDPIAVVLSLTQDNLIHSEILDWKLPPLPDRYLEACSEFKKSVDPQITELLDISRALNNLNLTNQNLNALNARPVLKALQHQNCLTSLDLSNNLLQNEGVKYLSQSLPTLKQLKSLNLSGNLITEKGLEFLSSSFERKVCLQELEELNLSYNPLKSSSLKHVGVLLQNSNLKNLFLKSCELDTFGGRERDINISNLKILDVSYNHFESNAFNTLLGKLNPHSIEILDLEASTQATQLQYSFSNWTMLREINLSKLNLSENEILEILRNLDSCDNLSILNLSYINDLTFLTMKFIVFNMSTKLRSVKLIGCKNLFNLGSLINIPDNAMRKYPRAVFLSVARNWSDDERNNYVDSLKVLWDKHSSNFGRIKLGKNSIKMYVEDYNDEQESDDFQGDIVK